MAYVWFLLFVAVSIWAYRASRRATELHAHNSALAADGAALRANNQALHHHSTALQYQMQQVVAENQELGKYRPIVEVDREILPSPVSNRCRRARGPAAWRSRGRCSQPAGIRRDCRCLQQGASYCG